MIACMQEPLNGHNSIRIGERADDNQFDRYFSRNKIFFLPENSMTREDFIKLQGEKLVVSRSASIARYGVSYEE